MICPHVTKENLGEKATLGVTIIPHGKEKNKFVNHA